MAECYAIETVRVEGGVIARTGRVIGYGRTAELASINGVAALSSLPAGESYIVREATDAERKAWQRDRSREAAAC